MNDLPKLIIGCGREANSNCKICHNGYWGFRCGDLCEAKHIVLCDTCQHNLNAVKSYAAAHHKTAEKLWKLSESNSSLTEEGKQHIRYNACNMEAARDAVLALAELSEKDLEGGKNEK